MAALVKNFKLLFANVQDVVIDDQGSLKNWINEASDEKYWCKLVKCLLNRNATIPERPGAPRTRRGRSPMNHNNAHNEQLFPPTPPRSSNNSNNDSNDTSNDRPPT